jgi:periplasmic divalent cation tolerance protein
LSALLILSTAPTREEAALIAEILVTEQLAACVQLSSIESWYRWEGKVEQAPEIRLHIKTIEALAEQVEQRIVALHSYAVPELIRVPISGGSIAYLQWIEDATRGS